MVVGVKKVRVYSLFQLCPFWPFNICMLEMNLYKCQLINKKNIKAGKRKLLNFILFYFILFYFILFYLGLYRR